MFYLRIVCHFSQNSDFLSQNSTFSSQIFFFFSLPVPGLLITTNYINLSYDLKCTFSLATMDLIQY